MRKTANAFTLVELAITIAIIAVLAAISVVSYSGVQQRAQTAAYTSAVDATEKQLRLYRTMVGPPLDEEFDPAQIGGVTRLPSACIGTLADFPAEGDFAAGECWIRYNSDGTRRETVSINDNLTSRFMREDGSFGVGKLPTVTYRSGGIVQYKARGIIVAKTDGNFVIGNEQSGTAWLIWLAADKSSCGRGVGNETANSGELQQMRPMISAYIQWIDGTLTTEQLVDIYITSLGVTEEIESLTPEDKAALVQQFDAMPQEQRQQLRALMQGMATLYDELLGGPTVCYRLF